MLDSEHAKVQYGVRLKFREDSYPAKSGTREKLYVFDSEEAADEFANANAIGANELHNVEQQERLVRKAVELYGEWEKVEEVHFSNPE